MDQKQSPSLQSTCRARQVVSVLYIAEVRDHFACSLCSCYWFIRWSYLFFPVVYSSLYFPFHQTTYSQSSRLALIGGKCLLLFSISLVIGLSDGLTSIFQCLFIIISQNNHHLRQILFQYGTSSQSSRFYFNLNRR